MAALLLIAPLVLALPAVGQEPKMESDEQKALYAMGFAIAQRLASADFTEAEVELIKLGMSDAVLNREPRVSMEQYVPMLDSLLRTRITAAAEREKNASQAYCETTAQQEGAQVSESGLVFIPLSAGTGASPSATDTVRLHYHGTLRDGKVFDSSRDRGEPASFKLDQVIPCFSEGLQKMKVGGKAKLVCPSSIAYGDRGAPPFILPGAALTFEIELLEIVSEPASTPAP